VLTFHIYRIYHVKDINMLQLLSLYYNRLMLKPHTNTKYVMYLRKIMYGKSVDPIV